MNDARRGATRLERAGSARPRLTQRRAIELSLAALVSGGALFSTFVTDAAPQSEGVADLPSPAIDLAQFARSDASAGSRAAVAAALGGQATALQLAGAPDIPGETGQSPAGSIALTPDITVRARAGAPRAQGWSGSALGVQMTASTRQLAEVLKTLEVLRTDGKIGASLQAEVDIYAKAQDVEILNSIGDQLKFLTITSRATAHESQDGLRIEAAPSAHSKCGRCWHYVDDVGQDSKHPDICARCVSNLAQATGG